VVASFPDGARRPKLLLAGAPQETYSAVRQLASDLNVLDSVCFLNHVDDVAALLSATDVGVLATDYEGTSNSLIEYMASGLPVIASDVPGNREVLGDYHDDQYFLPGDYGDLALQLHNMLAKPDVWYSVGHHNRERALKHFSIANMCNTTADILSSLLEINGARSRRLDAGGPLH
jgi:glycosyltransferase involved in cell wall biosynthesis